MGASRHTTDVLLDGEYIAFITRHLARENPHDVLQKKILNGDLRRLIGRPVRIQLTLGSGASGLTEQAGIRRRGLLASWPGSSLASQLAASSRLCHPLSQRGDGMVGEPEAARG